MSTKRIGLVINGVLRQVICDPEKDSLADVLRRMGLTGTKIGCNSGQCGACAVLLDGKVVRSCIKKMRMIEDGAEVITIEGVGTPEHLHPLQQAFITYGAVQCGFCTPGFIISALGLLNENPDPTRQEVRDWFTKNRNVCRCTGYKPIVDAVMAAAAVMRGEKTMEDITFSHKPGEEIYNTSYPRPGSLARVLGQAEYGDDVASKMPSGTAHLALVLAHVYHANIKSIDTSAADAAEGVLHVFTAKDVKGTNRMNSPKGSPYHLGDGQDHVVICDRKVHHYGDVVAVVAAETRELARAAAALVKVEYEELPAYLDFMQAAQPDAVQIHEGTPNVYAEQPLFKGEDTRRIFETAPYVVEGSFSTTRQSHLPIEPETVQAYPEGDGVCIQNKSQNLYGNIAAIANAIGLPKEKIRMMQNAVGGSFGYSMCANSSAIAAICALGLQRPVELTLSYPEHQVFTGKRAETHTNARLACDKDGKLVAMEFHMGLDNGAYSDTVGNKISKTVRFFGYPYNIPNIMGMTQACFSNRAFGIPYRAFGSPQTYTTSESLIDMMAEKVGMDPFEFRYRNVAREGDLNTNSVPYREYPMVEIMDMMRPYYEEFLADAKTNSTPEKRRGVGISWGGYHVSKSGDTATVALELNPDGSITHYNTWEEMGQGSDIGTLMHTHQCLRPLGLEPEQIHLVQNDTGTCPNTGSASASRSHHVAGMATIDAANQLMGAMRKPDGTFRTYAEMVAEGIPTKYEGHFKTPAKYLDISRYDGHGYGSAAQNYVLYLAEVEVDVATGKTTVLRTREISDIGVVGSRLAVEGQAFGGLSHSIGFALKEQYNDEKKHSTMFGAGIPLCNDIPDDMEILFHVTDRPEGPQKSTGCSESFQSSGHVAVLNAIHNAVGVRIYTLPATAEKVKAGMDALAAGKPRESEHWNLGCDFYTHMDELARRRDEAFTAEQK